MKNFLYKEIKIFSCMIIVYVLMLASCNSVTALIIGVGQNGLEANEEFHGCDTTPVCLGGDWPQQGPTNWCLATCMNIVYRDCLAKHHMDPNPILGPNPATDHFAELAFVLAPGEIDTNAARFQLDEQTYLKNHFGPIEFKNPVQQIPAISRHFKGLSREERNNIWNGGNPQPGTFAQNFGLLTGDPQAGLAAMPQGIKNSINTTVESVKMIFNQLIQNQNFVQHLEIVNYPGENFWRAVFNDIWDNQRIVIVNMVYANGTSNACTCFKLKIFINFCC